MYEKRKPITRYSPKCGRIMHTNGRSTAIFWNADMIAAITRYYPTTFNEELAWTSFDVVLRKANIRYKGFLGMDKERIHPTQKPIKLYEWLLKNYAKPTDKILDTHFGSCSIGIACHNFGCTLDACELDGQYFDSAYKRLKIHVGQLELFR